MVDSKKYVLQTDDARYVCVLEYTCIYLLYAVCVVIN